MDEIKVTQAEEPNGFYVPPPHGWTCFHCGETFTTPGAARDHFGMEPSADPGCRIKLGAERGLLMALRRAEAELSDAWAAIHSESTEAAKAYHAQQSRHHRQLVAAEEAGYERGLYDAAHRQAAMIEGARLMQALVARAVSGENGRVIPLASVFAGLVSGNDMPDMSGDARNRLHPHQRRRFDDAMGTLANAILALDPASVVGE